MSHFVARFTEMQQDVHALAREKGWWERPREDGTCMMLMVGEIAEAMEAARKNWPQDDKLPEFCAVTVELADCIIRIMDFAELHGLKLAEAINAKHEFNKSRPHRHGNKAF